MRFDVVDRAGCRWVDVAGPSREELHDLAREFSLPPTVVEDCLDPEHLPKHERIGDATFLILRARDIAAKDDASTVQGLTRKIAVFFREGVLLTIHRVDLRELRSVRERVARGELHAAHSELIASVVLAALSSYDEAMERAEETLSRFERGIFGDDVPTPTLRDAHNLKRRVALTRRILWQTSLVLHKLAPQGDHTAPVYQDLRETADAYVFWVEQILDEVNQLLQAHVAVSTQRTNEVVRVLTVFAAFFLPLTFVVGVYGMNFDYMPELRLRVGYPLTLLVLLGISLAILLWFRRRGWL
jgi:magnesium transporter